MGIGMREGGLLSKSGLRVYLLCYYLVWRCVVYGQLCYARVVGWVDVLVGE